MDISALVRRRYATKAFASDRQFPSYLLVQLLDLLRFAPSSTNSQPWHFIIAQTASGKARVASAAHGVFANNASKITNAQLCIVFCAKTDLSDEYLATVLKQEEQDGRFTDKPDFKQAVDAGRKMYADLHINKLNDAQHWMEKQVYLNMGFFLLGAAALGVDAVAIEGIDTELLNQEFQLSSRGFTAVALVAVGFRAENDFNASLPKSRFPHEQVFTSI